MLQIGTAGTSLRVEMSQLECGAEQAGGNCDEMTGTRRSCDIYMELMQWTALTGEGVQILDGWRRCQDQSSRCSACDVEL